MRASGLIFLAIHNIIRIASHWVSSFPWQAKELELQRVEARAAAADARVASLTAAAKQLRSTVADLGLFVDVLQAVSPDSRPLAELRASEARLKRDLQVGHEARV